MDPLPDPTRTRVLREEFARALRALPRAARKRVEELLLTSHRITEETIEEAKRIIEQELGPEKAERIISKYTELAFMRGSEYAIRQLKKYGVEVRIPAGLAILDEETLKVLKGLQLDLIKGLSEDTKKNISRVIREGQIAGKHPRSIAEELREVWKISKHRAEMIARTETIRTFNTAAERRYRLAGVEMYRYLAAADERTCSVCFPKHGKIFRLGDAGAPRPPLHPRCRCTISPVVRRDKQFKRSIGAEGNEIALQHYARVVAGIRKPVPDEKNVRRVARLLREDERFKELAGMAGYSTKEFAEEKAREALKILRENFRKHGIERAVELEGKGISVSQILRLKKRGKRYLDDVGDVNILGKIDKHYIWIVLNEKGQIKTVHKIDKKKFEKYKNRFKELK